MKTTLLALSGITIAAAIAACGSDDSGSNPYDQPAGMGATNGAGATMGAGATPGAGGAPPASGVCDTAVQQFPPAPICDQASRVCLSISVPDDVTACNECIQTAGTVGQDPNSALTQCSCQNCAIYLAACFASATWEAPNGDANRDQLCRAIVECGQANACEGAGCYLAADGSAGPCVAQIDAAAAASDGCAAGDITCVLNALGNQNSAVMRASEVGACVQGDSAAMPPIAGNCPGLL